MPMLPEVRKELGALVYEFTSEQLERQGDQYVGPCIVCGEGDDRFWYDESTGLFGCRKCHENIGVDEFFKEMMYAIGHWNRDFIEGMKGNPQGSTKRSKNPDFWKPPEPNVHFYVTEEANGEQYKHYQYFEEGGNPLAQTVKRVSNGKKWRRLYIPDYDKTKPWVNKDPTEQQIYNDRCKHLMYKKSELIVNKELPIINITEGESDTLTLNDYGFVSTTNISGGKNFSILHARQIPEDSIVVAWQDNDSTGAARMDRIFTHLASTRKHYKKIVVITPEMMGFDSSPENRKQEDVTDYVNSLKDKGFSKEEIRDKIIELIFEAMEHEPKTDTNEPSQAQSDKYDTSQMALARMLIRNHGSEMLIVEPDEYDKYKFPTIYTSDHKGRWTKSGSRPLRWLFEGVEALQAELQKESFNKKTMYSIYHSLNKLKTSKELEMVLNDIAGVNEIMLKEINQGVADRKDWKTMGVQTCREDELDQDYRYLGCLNGIVDLDTGEFAHNPRAALVTQQIPTRYNPNAKHPLIDDLFAHLSEEAQSWWWNLLGYHLRYGASRRFYLIVGPPKGGKTTLNHLLRGALGPYVGEAFAEVLDAKRANSSAMLTPERFVFLPPYRFTILSDLDKKRKDSTLIKKISGGDPLTVRTLRQKPVTRVCRTTIMFMGNPGSVPKFNLADPAVMDRFFELPYDAVPKDKQDPELVELAKSRSPAITEAFLNKLVQYSVQQKMGVLPATPNIVQEAVDEREESEGTSLKDFAERFCRMSSVYKIDKKEVWRLWCENFECTTGQEMGREDVGGQSFYWIISNLQEYTRVFDKQVRYRVGGKQVRGYVGVKYMNDDEWNEYCDKRDNIEEHDESQDIHNIKEL